MQYFMWYTISKSTSGKIIASFMIAVLSLSTVFSGYASAAGLPITRTMTRSTDEELAIKTGNSRWLEGVAYIKRKDRWADETWRLTARTEYQKILAAQKQFEGTEEEEPTESELRNETATDYVLKMFAGEFTMDRISKWNVANPLWWPQQYRVQKTKILVHHTADNNKSLPSTIAQEKEYMKNLYRYHAFSRGRGDIGYNFVIMPSGRIYEWRAGGAGVVGAHATWNNTPSVGISVVGNFEEKIPEQAQVVALTNLTTAVAKRYNINPLKETNYFKATTIYPYIKVEKHQAIAWHMDAWSTKCPGKYLYALLGDIKKVVAERLADDKVQVASNPLVIDNFTEVKNNYITKNNIKPTTASTKRLEWAPQVKDISTIVQKPIPVLLYDASITLDQRDLQCSSTCIVRINGLQRPTSSLLVKKDGKQFAVTIGTKIYKTLKFAVSVAPEWTIKIKNYNRMSGKLQLNTFRQALLFLYGPVKQIDKQPADQHHVINIVSLDNYMKWIWEASDSQTQTKANTLALLSKAYILYYAGWTIRHSSIPAGALYVITDDPRISQKYSGAGWENASKKRPLALQQTKNMYITYNGALPLLPYFHCSAGFTWSAKEKRWWTDTPYLVSVDDAGGKCESGDFEWHGIWLSWNGSSKMADAGKSVDQIIQYYYPGTQIVQK